MPVDHTASPISSLALAVVGASDTPMLLLDSGMIIAAASLSFCATFGLAPAEVVGKLIFDLDDHSWNKPRLRSLLNATSAGLAAVERYELNLTLPRLGTRRLVLKAQKLEYDGADAERMLVSIADVTDARLSASLTEELLRDKTMLINEVQHRVANSLQIVASILMQSARKVQSDEARGHLTDAHQRVMSIATLQRHLAESGKAETQLAPYLTQLCDSIGASMIYDHQQLSLSARIDSKVVAEEISVSLGLIVTELVINALKHAFPEKRVGHILVDYAAEGLDWTLSVSDDGIGMSHLPAPPAPGLGTSIVQALAKQLHADIDVIDLAPGTRISVVHGRKQAAQDAANDGPEDVAV